jgi:hypothetical protein
MWQEVLKVIKPFLQFLKSFDSDQIHNMLDPCVKSLPVVENYVGIEKQSTLQLNMV